MASVSDIPQIELRGVHRFFGPTHAVNDVSFCVYPGEVFGYIGPNGAGKTTSMRILATLDEPSSGDALVDGFSVTEDPDRVRRRLGFMPDYFGTYDNVDVHEYLDFFARAYGLRGKERTDAISFVKDFTGLYKLEHKPISGLSKGMKQRLCLGRTMIHDPPVMVLDEPAAGLDPRARIELREMITRLAELGKAILISSHILTELAEVCDRVAIIEAGQLLAVGSVEEISRRVATVSQVEFRVLGDPGPAERWIAEREDLRLERQEGGRFTLQHAGTDAEQVVLLRELVAAGLEVVEYRTRAKSLEDVFLEVTKGIVQ